MYFENRRWCFFLTRGKRPSESSQPLDFSRPSLCIPRTYVPIEGYPIPTIDNIAVIVRELR